MNMPANTRGDSKQPGQSPWERLGPIASGGTVSGLAISPVRQVLGVWVAPTPHVPLYWAATPCGSFRSYTSGYHWDQYLAGLTTPLLSTLAVAYNGELFAGALDGSLFLSDDFGLTWEPGSVPGDLRAPVTAMVASPNFRQDQTVLAATDGAGILVTRDGGRNWQASRRHLHSSSVLALAVTPDWSMQATVFAATPQGVSISLDGGRTWRATSLRTNHDAAQDAVDALAVSPAFESDHTVYAGTEAGRLYQSRDGGRTWDLLQAEAGGGLVGDGPVSALWLARDFAESGRIVCGVGSSIYVSSDRGQSWQLAASLPGLVLVLAGDERSVIAGLRDAGVWESRDSGLTWASATGDLAARGFAWLKTIEGRLYAAGPLEGVWASEDGGSSWNRLPGIIPHLPLTAISMERDNVLLAASHTGDILRSTDRGDTWHIAGHAQGLQALLLSPGTDDGSTAAGWAGTNQGELLVSHDNGATWQEGGVPCPGQSILSFAVSPDYARDHSLLMGTAVPASAREPAHIAVWRSNDSGATWRQVAAQPTSAGWLNIAMLPGTSPDPAARAILAAGQYVLYPSESEGSAWVSTTVDPSGANVLSVVAAGAADQGELMYAATGSGVFCSSDGSHSWKPDMDGLDPRTFLSLTLVSSPAKRWLYALSLGGILWRREI